MGETAYAFFNVITDYVSNNDKLQAGAINGLQANCGNWLIGKCAVWRVHFCIWDAAY